MTKQSHLFIMDPLEKLNKPLDTSLGICRALLEQGESVYFAEPSHLFRQHPASTGRVHAREFIRTKENELVLGENSPAADLTSFASIHMRKDPPYDLDYIATTWLLETARGSGQIYNDPNALRGVNEKLAILDFPDACKPALLSSNPQQILDFVKSEAQGDAILKPLHLFGGRGVTRLNLQEVAEAQALSLLTKETQEGRSWRFVQPFDRNIFKGEVRAFSVGGNALAWCLKKPREGSFLANTAAGASLLPYKPSPEEIARVETVAKKLWQKGVAFIGFDLIGGFVSEINITSPRLLKAPRDQRPYYQEIAQWICSNPTPRAETF